MKSFTMELVKNKVSGRYFVVLDDSNDSCFLVVTPEGKVKNLQRHLFDTDYLVDPLDMALQKIITKYQLDIYMEYFNE